MLQKAQKQCNRNFDGAMSNAISALETPNWQSIDHFGSFIVLNK